MRQAETWYYLNPGADRYYATEHARSIVGNPFVNDYLLRFQDGSCGYVALPLFADASKTFLNNTVVRQPIQKFENQRKRVVHSSVVSSLIVSAWMLRRHLTRTWYWKLWNNQKVLDADTYIHRLCMAADASFTMAGDSIRVELGEF